MPSTSGNTTDPDKLPHWLEGKGATLENNRRNIQAVILSTVPHHKRSPWGTDDDEVVAVFDTMNNEWRPCGNGGRFLTPNAVRGVPIYRS